MISLGIFKRCFGLDQGVARVRDFTQSFTDSNEVIASEIRQLISVCRKEDT